MSRLNLNLSLIALFVTGVGAGAANAQLPDFTGLVEETAPAVVNIETVKYGTRPDTEQSQRQMPNQEEIPELFRRFFGPFEDGRRGRPDRRTGGSGFIISDEGHIVTNHHVVDGADEVAVTLADRREFTAEVIGSDDASDIALLKIDADEDLPVLEFGDSDKLKRGQWVYAIGSPFTLEQTVTAGIVSGKGRSNAAQQYVPFIQSDVAINRGNSGGPLLNMDGKVVGINSWILSSSGGYIGLSFSIPSDVARNTIRQLREKGYVARGLLGVGIEEVSREKAEAVGLDRPHGALVNRVEPDSAAENAGIEVGDVIVEFEGESIETYGELPPLVGSTPPGTEVEVVVHRWGDRKTLDVVLDELPQDEQASTGGQRSGEPANALGLVVEGLSPEMRQNLEGVDGGVVVTEIESDAAYRAGLRRGDVILKVNNRPIADVGDFNEIVEAMDASRSVALLVYRDGTTSFIAYRPENVE